MAPTSKTGAGAKKSIKGRSSKSSQPGAASKIKKKTGPKPAPVQHKPKPSSQTANKKKPPHLRYTEKELKVPQLNGIRPAGVQKLPNVKKGKTFVDDRESMNAIMALVMAEKEGNIESKMMRARQMEEVREAKRLEAEKRAASKKEGLEERKSDIKNAKKKNGQFKRKPHDASSNGDTAGKVLKKRKRVSFG